MSLREARSRRGNSVIRLPNHGRLETSPTAKDARMLPVSRRPLPGADLRARKQPVDRRAASVFRVISMLIATAVAPAALPALDPQKQLGQFNHESWTSQRGLPGEAVYQILQSKDGYLWVRTGAGLARFDGVRFTSMDAEIGSEPVKAICMGADGDLLIRTATRTVIYKDRHFSDYRPSAPWPAGSIRVLFESREHVVFVGADDFIYRIEKNGSATTLRSHTGWINTFLEDDDGKVWIGGSPSIYLYDGKTLSEALDKTASRNTVTSLSEDRRHRIWVATGDGLYRLHAQERTLEPVHRKGLVLMTALLEDGQGSLWGGTETKGIVRIAQDGSPAPGFSSFDFLAGLTDDSVLSLLEDNEGTLWIGTASGLDQLRDTRLTTFTTREGLPSNRAKSAIAMRDGAVEVFTDSGGLASIRNGIVKPFDQNRKLPYLAGAAMFASRDGSLWLGTYRALNRIQGDKVTSYTGGRHFYDYFVSAIAEDNESLIVTNAESQAFRFKGGKVSPYLVGGKSTPVSNAGVYTFTIYNDPAGTLWFGTSDGLFEIPAAGRQGAGRKAGTGFPVASIYDDGRGNLWLGGRTPGIVQFRIADGRVTHYAKRDGLFDVFASYILGDSDGNLWISTEDGIYSVSEKQLDAFSEGKTNRVSSTRYGLEDGMKTTEASDVASQPGGCRTPDGKLWFTTKKGIVAVDPARIAHNNLIPPVIVESVVADGKMMPNSGALRLSPGTHAIEISYTALSLRIPQRVRFKYRLEGYDRDWVDAGSRRVAYYTNLPPGDYRFRVIASNDDGLWNIQGASVAMVLQPRFYQTTYFLLVCLLLGVVAVIAANRLTTRMIRVRADRLSMVVDERTAELRQSQIELDLLAHFDTLTALPNRRRFTEEFARMCSPDAGSEFTLLLVDVDRFKAINDTFGHDAGDAFLVETSRRLSSAVRSTDILARLGGDEFAILLPGRHEEPILAAICDRIVQSIALPVEFNGASLMAGVSVGVAIFPRHGDTQEKLYKSTDLALYEAKRMGRNMWRRYAPELESDALREKQAS